MRKTTIWAVAIVLAIIAIAGAIKIMEQTPDADDFYAVYDSDGNVIAEGREATCQFLCGNNQTCWEQECWIDQDILNKVTK